MSKKIMAFVFLVCALLCVSVVEANPYTASNPLIIGFEDFPGTDDDNQDLVVNMYGNFSLVTGCGSGQNSCVPNGAWQPMVVPNEDGSPYWDGNSSDSSQLMNVGNHVLGTGGFTGNPNSPNWGIAGTQYFGTNSGGAAGFYFKPVSGNVTTDMKIEVSANANVNYLAYALLSAPNTDYILFSGPANPGSTISFTPPSDFILKFNNGTSTYRTDGNIQAAAAFQQTPVPEPMTFLLIGGGLVGIAALRRRQQKVG
ncbi:MAG: PEP-CTERM sorting domain-containing protein [Minisyncoccota bacterium]